MDPNDDTSQLSAVSLFSGAGGMDVGVRAAGFDIVLANDVDADACATYRLNHGPTIVEGSLTDILPAFPKIKGIDLLFGGPPCQGFSVAGRMDPSDPRSALMSSYFDAVEAIKPRAFICENVKALASLHRWEGVRTSLIERASRLYHVHLMVLRASDFGVPQNRDRMFIVGVRKAEGETKRYDIAGRLQRLLKAARFKPKSIGEVIRGLGPAGSQGNRRTCNAKITYAKAPVLRRSPYAGMLFNGAGRPFDGEGVAPTLPASMGGNKTPIVDEQQIFSGDNPYVAEYHKALINGARAKQGNAPSRLRRLTVDECLAIQTFPRDYLLAGSRSAMYRQIGNAVPCALAEVVARAVKQILDERGSASGTQSDPFIPDELARLVRTRQDVELNVAA